MTNENIKLALEIREEKTQQYWYEYYVNFKLPLLDKLLGKEESKNALVRELEGHIESIPNWTDDRSGEIDYRKRAIISSLTEVIENINSIRGEWYLEKTI